MEKNEIIKRISFRIAGTRSDDNREIDVSGVAELSKSGAFEYGNHTCLVIRWSYGEKEVFDTRYEKGIVSSFETWLKKFLQGRTADGLTVTFTE